jgi:hypothetical protein
MAVAALAADDPKDAAFDAEQVDDDTSALGHGSRVGRSAERLRASSCAALTSSVGATAS